MIIGIVNMSRALRYISSIALLLYALSISAQHCAFSQTFGEGVIGWTTVPDGSPPSATPGEACQIQYEAYGKAASNQILPYYLHPPRIADCHWTSFQNGCAGGINSCGTIQPSNVTFQCMDGYTQVGPNQCAPNNEITPPGAGCPAAGNPITLYDAAKREDVTDFATADGRFHFGRAYRSFSSTFGVKAFNRSIKGSVGGWRFSLGPELHLAGSSADGATLHTPEGVGFDFNRSGSTFTPAATGVNPRARYALSLVGTAPADWSNFTSTRSQWQVIDTVERTTWLLETSSDTTRPGGSSAYDVGRPLSVTWAGGYRWTYAYDPSGVPRSIIDSYGRTFKLTWLYYLYPQTNTSASPQYIYNVYVPVAISAVGLPDGGSLRYTYDPPVDASGNLTTSNLSRLVKIERLDANQTAINTGTYQYENTTFPDLLTGITDARGVRYATFSYDERGRAISTQHANGQDTYSIAFNTPSTSLPNELVRTVTNPLGKATEYHWAHPSDPHQSQLTSVVGIASSNCVASNSTYTYDANGFVASVTDEEGRVTAYINDARGRPTSITRGAGTPQAVTTSNVWDATYDVATQIVEPGVTTTQTLDPTTGLITKIQKVDTTTQTVPYSTNGQTRTVTFAYDSKGQLASTQGPLSNASTAYTYDKGYLKTFTNELGQVTTVNSVNALGQPTGITDPRGIITALTYDPLGHLTSASVDTAHTPATTTITYSPVGDVLTITDPIGAVETFVYDDARRLTNVTNSAGETATYTRDAMSNATAVAVTNSSTTTTYSKSRTFDELGRLIQSVGAVAANSRYRFGYDRTDNLTSVMDPRSNVFAYGFDALNRLTQEIDEEDATVTLTRNGIDAITSYQDPRSIMTTYVRNGFGEIIQENSPDKGTTVYYRDANGNVTQRSDPRGSVPSISDLAVNDHRTLDTKGNVTSYARTISTVPTFTSTYSYDLNGNITGLTYPSGRIVTFQRDGLGRVSSVATQQSASTASQPIASSVTWAPFSGVASFIFGNGISQTFSRDTDDRITAVVAMTPASANVVNRALSWTGETLDSIIDNQFPGNTPPFTLSAQSQSFTYTPTHRLSGATGYYGTLAWTYDATGNRTQETKNGVASVYAYPTTSNRLASITPSGGVTRNFTYDAGGNVVTDTGAGTPPLTFEYDAEGRLAKAYQTATPANGGVYAYDADSRLSARIVTQTSPSTAVTTYYAYDTQDHIIAELDSGGQTLREYIWLDDMPLAVVDNVSTSPVTYYVQVDHLMRPARMTDANLNWVWDVVFDPFGTTTYLHENPANIDIRFPGQWFQLETGLAYNWHRHYDPTLGRYIQPDPLIVDDGTPSIHGIGFGVVERGIAGNMSAIPTITAYGGQSARTIDMPAARRVLQDGPSVYGYAGQNALRSTDPTGLGWLDWFRRNTVNNDACPTPNNNEDKCEKAKADAARAYKNLTTKRLPQYLSGGTSGSDVNHYKSAIDRQLSLQDAIRRVKLYCIPYPPELPEWERLANLPIPKLF